MAHRCPSCGIEIVLVPGQIVTSLDSVQVQLQLLLEGQDKIMADLSGLTAVNDALDALVKAFNDQRAAAQAAEQKGIDEALATLQPHVDAAKAAVAGAANSAGAPAPGAGTTTVPVDPTPPAAPAPAVDQSGGGTPTPAPIPTPDGNAGTVTPSATGGVGPAA